jgi:hypothetical protein
LLSGNERTDPFSQPGNMATGGSGGFNFGKEKRVSSNELEVSTHQESEANNSGLFHNDYMQSPAAGRTTLGRLFKHQKLCKLHH